MTRAIDTSFTLLEAGQSVDVTVFGDPDRYIAVEDGPMAEALWKAITPEAPRKTVTVGGGSARTEVDVYVLDLRRDRGLQREIARLLHDAFVDATAGALKSPRDDLGFLDATATPRINAVERVIELRRFLFNAAAMTKNRRKRELLFHHAVPAAAE